MDELRFITLSELLNSEDFARVFGTEHVDSLDSRTDRGVLRRSTRPGPIVWTVRKYRRKCFHVS
jgi:hypothetical protein